MRCVVVVIIVGAVRRGILASRLASSTSSVSSVVQDLCYKPHDKRKEFPRHSFVARDCCTCPGTLG